MGVAALLKDPTFEISADEAKRLAEAGQKVARHYQVMMTQKQADIAQFAMIAGSIYGPRLFIAAMRPKAPQQQSAPPSNMNGAIVGGDVSAGDGPAWGDFAPGSVEIN